MNPDPCKTCELTTDEYPPCPCGALLLAIDPDVPRIPKDGWTMADIADGAEIIADPDYSENCPVAGCDESLETQTAEETLIGGLTVTQHSEVCPVHGIIFTDDPIYD